MFYVIISIIALWVVLNIVVSAMLPLNRMAKVFWSEQKWYGKIAVNLLYAPAWVFSALVIALVCVFYWTMVVLHKFFKWVAVKCNKLYNKAISLNL